MDIGAWPPLFGVKLYQVTRKLNKPNLLNDFFLKGLISLVMTLFFDKSDDIILLVSLCFDISYKKYFF